MTKHIHIHVGTRDRKAKAKDADYSNNLKQALIAIDKCINEITSARRSDELFPEEENKLDKAKALANQVKQQLNSIK